MSKDNRDKEILDSDADGLMDQEERQLGTDPQNPDSDQDHLDDYQEVKVYKTDPLDPDTDCDDLGDGTEVKMGRNPLGPGSLKDFWLPNKCNDYRPGILNPKRLAFHAFAAVAIKVVMVVFALSFPVQAWLTPNILNEQSSKVVRLTNDIRAGLNVGLLQENIVLNNAALNKAQDMMVNEYFAHVGPDSRGLRNWLFDAGYSFSVAGENLALGFPTAEEVVDAWTKSPTHYSNMIDPDFTEIGVGAVSGQYQGYDTTMVAQYFATPIVAAVAEVEDTEESVEPVDNNDYIPEYSRSNEEENAPEEEVLGEEIIVAEEENVVLAEKEETEEIMPVLEPLEVPTLLSPNNKTVSKENLNILKVSAPQAEKIAIFDNDKQLLTKNISNSIVDFSVDLAEGEHNLKIFAWRGEEEAYSMNYTLTVDKTLPVIDQENTKLLVNKPVGQEDIVVKATAYLSPDSANARVDFDNYDIELSRDYSEDNKWSGSKIISGIDYDELFGTVVLASLTVSDQAGNSVTNDINWENITPVENSVMNQYVFLKNSPSENIKPLFDFTSIYYKVMLVIAVVALLFNVFVEIRKQHTHTIASTMGLIILVTFLTIF